MRDGRNGWIANGRIAADADITEYPMFVHCSSESRGIFSGLWEKMFSGGTKVGGTKTTNICHEALLSGPSGAGSCKRSTGRGENIRGIFRPTFIDK